MTDYSREVECTYKGERYSVRDNGEVLRHPREDKRKRKLDNNWTFATSITSGGYCRIGSEYVHRIVATAFLGEPPTSKHDFIDHIDTNRRNNRPENLRWVTKLENILENPITRKRIILACGSIEAFLEDPSLLDNHENKDPNFSWMKNVTSEEARITLKRMRDWAKREESSEDKPEVNEPIESKTPGAVQKNWETPSEFPLCPPEISKTSLDQYLKNLKNGRVFARNKYGESIVHSADLSENSEALLVLSNIPDGVKKWSLARISIEGKHFVHESMGTFFNLEGALKQFITGCGMKWEGSDLIDDYS